MSCSTAVTTNWTPSTSHVTATSTHVLTSISTPQASISTRLLTTCISTRRSTARSVPTGGVSVPARDGNESEIEDLTVAASRTQLDDNNRRRHRPTSTSTGTDLTSDGTESTLRLERRQVPPGLPENCVRWTVIPSLSTLAVTPSTLLKTTTTLSSSITTIWGAEETVHSDCPTSTASSAVPSTSTSTDIPIPSSTEIESEMASSSVTPEDKSTQAASTTSETNVPTPSGTWGDELSRFSDLSAASQTVSSIDSTSSGIVAVQTIDTVSNGTAVPLIVIPSSTTAQNPTSSPKDSGSILIPTSSSSRDADAGAATQASSSKEGSSKAVSAGAAIGGVIGIFLLIAFGIFVLRWWMRRKRGNARKTVLMRQSWYPPGYDGPDHVADTPTRTPHEKTTVFGKRDRSMSFFSMSGQGPGNPTPSDSDKDLPSPPIRRFQGLNLPRIAIPFFSKRASEQEILDYDKAMTPDLFHSSNPNTTGVGPMSKVFPGLSAPWASPNSKIPIVPAWAEKYQDEPLSRTSNQPIHAVPATSRRMRDDRDAAITRNILKPHPETGRSMDPPRLNYEPPDGHMSWGLPKNTSPPKRASRGLPTMNRPNLDWGHSYAASTSNPDPRRSVMPPPPTGLQTGFIPQIPPSPTEGSVYSKRESHRSLTSRASTNKPSDEPRQLWHSRFSRDQQASSTDHGTGADLGRKPSGLSNPALRSAILSRASASVPSLGHLSFQSGTTDHTLPPLPEGGLRLDFPLPPSPSTRAPTMMFPTPTNVGNVPASNTTRPLMPSRPSIKAFVPNTNNLDGNSSSIFEYADYTRTSNYTTATATANANATANAQGGPSNAIASGSQYEPGGRDTIRQTADWYDKPLWVWDGQSGPLPRIPTDYSGWDGQSWRQSQSGGQSRKSVRWDPADGVARAL